GEGQAHEHTGGVIADRQVEGVAELAELDNAAQAGANRRGCEPLQIAAVEDVVPAAGVQLEAEGDVEQGGHRSLDAAGAVAGPVDAAEDAQEGALAGAVAADDGEALAFLDLERDVAQGVDLAAFGPRPPAAEQPVLERGPAA